MYILLMICTSFMCLSWINSFFTMYTPKCQWGRPTWKARQSSKCSIPRPKCRAGGIDSNWSKTFSFKSSSIYWPPPFRFSDLPLALKYYVRTPICTYMSVSLYDFTVHTFTYLPEIQSQTHMPFYMECGLFIYIL